jgi:HEAT repeat protein
LVQALGDPDPWVRSGAVISLENFGPQILPALADLQNDPRPGVRTNAMKTLLAIKKLEPWMKRSGPPLATQHPVSNIEHPPSEFGLRHAQTALTSVSETAG